MKSKTYLFFKAAFVTTLCLGLIMILVTGIIISDNNYNETVGSQLENRLEYSKDDSTLYFSLFGSDYEFDTSFVKDSEKAAQNYTPIIAPEIRLIYTAVKDVCESIEDLIF